MTIEPTDVARHPGPAYQAIAEALAAAIGEGRLKAGDRLPPQRELAWRLKVTVGTVGRAYDVVTQRGLVRGEVGRGTYVLERASQLPASWLRHAAPTPDSVDLGANVPSPTAAQAGLADALQAMAREPQVAAELTVYPPVIGQRRHRAQGSLWLRRLGIEATAETVIVTGGAQGALAATLSAIAPPGSTVLVEALTYNGARTLGRRLGIRLEPVAIDEEGLVPDALEAAARATGARGLIVCPTIQNPTTAIMGEARRRRLALLSTELDLTIIEDDVYGPLLAAPPPPLAAFAPERTVFIVSASKFLAPGLRMAFAVAPRHLVEPIGEAMAVLTLANPPLTAELFCRCLDNGTIEAALLAQRDEAAARQLLAARLLDGADFRAAPTGLHLWLHLPECWTSTELSIALARQGILVAPAERFHMGRGAPPRAVRLSISAPPERAMLEDALTRIGLLLGRRSIGPANLV